MLGKTNAVNGGGEKTSGSIFDYKFPAFNAAMPCSLNSGGSVCSCLNTITVFDYEIQNHNFNDMHLSDNLLTQN